MNLGDVIEDRGDIYGDGVNVAARLEALAEPGGICISDAVRSAVGRKLDPSYQDLGEQQVKNIEEPVRAYKIVTRAAEELGTPKSTLELPERPSIAVLPFINMSGKPKQEYFADGMTEDIITGLIRFPSLFVIARNSTFAYKDRVQDVTEVAKRLGVRYVLQGSIRKGGDRLRITAQLIDVESGNNLWAERYDRNLGDLFAVQDDVTEAIVSAIAPEIRDAERKRALRTPPQNLDTWGLYQRGLVAYYIPTVESLMSAIELFDKAGKLDPSFAHTFAMAAQALLRLMRQNPLDNWKGRLAQAHGRAKKAIALAPRDPICLAAHGRVLAVSGQRDAAVSILEEAVALNPSYADARARLAGSFLESGRSEEAIVQFDHALRLSPHDPYSASFRHMRAGALLDLGQYEACAQSAHLATESLNPPVWAYAILAAALTKLDRKDEAKAALGEIFQRVSDFSLEHARQYMNHYAPKVAQRRIELYREAGVPEVPKSH